MAKVMRKEAWHTQRRDQASGNPLFPSISPQTRVLYRELSPITISLRGVNLQLQLIKIPGHTRVFQLTNSGGSLACLIRLVRPHVIVYSLPTVRGMGCFKTF